MDAKKSICKYAGDSKPRLCAVGKAPFFGHLGLISFDHTDTGANPSAGHSSHSVPLRGLQDRAEFLFEMFLLNPSWNVLLCSQES